MVEQPRVNPDLPDLELIAAYGSGLEFDRALAPLTSFGTGGSARYFLAVKSTEELAKTITTSQRLAMPFFILGGGSNLLVSDAGFDGLVIKLEITGLELVEDTVIEAGGGESLAALVEFATRKALTGLEFAAGIWGSVGGAVFGNAGAYGGEIGRVMSRAVLIDEAGRGRDVAAEYFEFEYRSSRLKETGEILATARFELANGDRSSIENRVREILGQRSRRHPSERTAGCFFKNIPDATQPHGKMPAGRLLEEAGAAGLSVGGARVYEKHANIIVTDERATSKDIRLLADRMKKIVFDRFGIELREEIRHLGSFD